MPYEESHWSDEENPIPKGLTGSEVSQPFGGSIYDSTYKFNTPVGDGEKKSSGSQETKIRANNPIGVQIQQMKRDKKKAPFEYHVSFIMLTENRIYLRMNFGNLRISN